MVEFENPYAEHSPFIGAYFGCLDCGGKLWEYAIDGQMVCEECRSVFDSEVIFDDQISASRPRSRTSAR